MLKKRQLEEKKNLNDNGADNNKSLENKIANSKFSSFQPLSTSDIDLICLRFELGGRIDVVQFISYFNDNKDNVNGTGKVHGTSMNPFRFSSEWSTLKLGE